MEGYCFCIKDPNNKSDVGWEYLKKHQSEWKAFNYEESSIDMNLMNDSRFVVDGVCHECVRQYFIRESDTVVKRLIVLSPLLMKKENEELCDAYKNNRRYSEGYDYTKKEVINEPETKEETS